MALPFPASFLVAQQKTQCHSGKHAAAVGPVVDRGKKETEQEDTDGPSSYLAENGLSVDAPPALAKI